MAIIAKSKMNLPVAIGAFDGVHKGHFKLFKSIKTKFNVILITNIPHNKKNFLFTLQDRIRIIRQSNLKCDEIYIYKLNKQNKCLTHFIKYLQKINPSKIFVGNNWKFGMNRSYSYKDLKKYFKVKNIALDKKYNTTQIKSLISNGEITKANKCLINNYFIGGEVIHGKHLGRILGYPTANVLLSNNQIIPKNGCYASITCVANKSLPSATFVRNKLIETYVFEFNQNIYGHYIYVYLQQYIGEPVVTKSITQLKKIIKSRIYAIKRSINCHRFSLNFNKQKK